MLATCPPLISLRNVEKYFEHGPTKTFVLRRINLDIKDGEFISIMGPSGAGKSTLLHVLGMHDSAWTGEYYLAGSSDPQDEQEGPVGVVQEVFRICLSELSLLDSLTVYENLDIPLSYRNVKKSEARQHRVRRARTNSRWSGKKDLFPNQLSGGQQQLVAIARADHRESRK